MNRRENQPQIHADRLWDSLMEFGRIGATANGGVCRLALTDEDQAARALFVSWANALGCAIHIDRIGNIFAKRAGRDPSRPVVMTGSHIDTQPTGGKFDGNFGVLAGLEVLRALTDAGVETEADIEIAVWTNEEGSRFVPVMMGSAVYAGACSVNAALAARDVDGKSVGEELQRIGFAGQDRPAARIDSYFEAHIEQGPILQDWGRKVGVVTGALGQRWFDCIVTGFEAHAGPTPMPLRRDALQAAAAMIQEVIAVAARRAPHARGTVGFVSVYPNSRNVIPGRVQFSIDLRAPEEGMLDEMEGELLEKLKAIEQSAKVGIRLKEVSRFAAMRFDLDCVGIVRQSARACGHTDMDVVSGAGHDAIHLASIAPAAMIFIPCKDGISHNEVEYAEPADVRAGAEVLMHCILERAGIAN